MMPEQRAILPTGWQYCSCWRWNAHKHTWSCVGCDRCRGTGYIRDALAA
jgi:hypothetical protein